MNLEEQLAKALANLETERQRNANAEEKIQEFQKTLKELTEKYHYQKIALKAYTDELNELRNPVTLEQIEQSYSYEQQEFWDSLNSLSEDKQYQALKGYLSHLDELCNAETERLVNKLKEKYQEEIDEVKPDIIRLKTERTKFFGMFKAELSEKEKADLSDLLGRSGRAKSALKGLDTEWQQNQLRETAFQNICNESPLKQMYSKTAQAKSFVKQYETAKEKTW